MRLCGLARCHFFENIFCMYFAFFLEHRLYQFIFYQFVQIPVFPYFKRIQRQFLIDKVCQLGIPYRHGTYLFQIGIKNLIDILQTLLDFY